MKYVIKNYTGDIEFGGIQFETFEDAWEYLLEAFPDEGEDMFEGYAVENVD